MFPFTNKLFIVCQLCCFHCVVFSVSRLESIWFQFRKRCGCDSNYKLFVNTVNTTSLLNSKSTEFEMSLTPYLVYMCCCSTVLYEINSSIFVITFSPLFSLQYLEPADIHIVSFQHASDTYHILLQHF